MIGLVALLVLGTGQLCVCYIPTEFQAQPKLEELELEVVSAWKLIV
jgi:hypothetical protein